MLSLNESRNLTIATDSAFSEKENTGGEGQGEADATSDAVAELAQRVQSMRLSTVSVGVYMRFVERFCPISSHPDLENKGKEN